MIINQNNKDFILKGTLKRGFNQTPKEIRDKMLNQNTNQDKQKENKDNLMEEYFKIKKARNELKRF